MKEEIKSVMDFVFDTTDASIDYCSVYIKALKILGELPKDQWTPYDVIDTIQRAIKVKD